MSYRITYKTQEGHRVTTGAQPTYPDAMASVQRLERQGYEVIQVAAIEDRRDPRCRWGCSRHALEDRWAL